MFGGVSSDALFAMSATELPANSMAPLGILLGTMIVLPGEQRGCKGGTSHHKTFYNIIPGCSRSQSSERRRLTEHSFGESTIRHRGRVDGWILDLGCGSSKAVRST
jgi:hypothetical protein